MCCAAMPAVALANPGHVHTAECNHQFVDEQGTYKAGPSNDRFKVASESGGGMKFILIDTGGVGEGTVARKAFEAAARYWSNILTDDITIRLNVQFSQLGPNILGSTGSTTNAVGYNTVRNALIADAKTQYDAAAVKSLTAGPLTFVSNEPPNAGPINTATRFLDNNNTFDNNNLSVNTAQMKAMGLNPVYASTNVNQVDGSVSFSTLFNWDFDPTNGIGEGLIDFVGVAAHEIGHALGFRSGVDLADVNAMPFIPAPGRRGLGNIAWGTVNDLFRYGSFDGQTIRDWSIGGTPCHSIDGGKTCTGLLSTARNNGDGRQASHWKDDTLLNAFPPIGIMDPTASGPGGTRPFQKVTRADAIAFDVMGYDLNVAAIPEPQTWAMMIIGFGAVGFAARRRQRVAVSFG